MAQSRTKEYRAWTNMKSRCVNPNHPKYRIYWGRGISFCESWLSFDGFLSDMGLAPSSKHTLDRIDTNRGYCKENCRWATQKQQQRNKRVNTLVGGKTLSEWSEILGVKRSTLAQRYYVYGWSVDKILST